MNIYHVLNTKMGSGKVDCAASTVWDGCVDLWFWSLHSKLVSAGSVVTDMNQADHSLCAPWRLKLWTFYSQFSIQHTFDTQKTNIIWCKNVVYISQCIQAWTMAVKTWYYKWKILLVTVSTRSFVYIALTVPFFYANSFVLLHLCEWSL